MSKIKKRVDKSISILQASKSPVDRKAAVKDLCKIGLGAKKALPELMKLIYRSEEFIIQGLAEEAVIKIGEPAIPFIRKLLRSLQWKKRSKGIEILGEIALKDKETVNKILQLVIPVTLRDINYHVRLDAVTLIGKLATKNKKNTAVIELLGEVLRNDRNQLVYREASNILSQIGSKEAIYELVKSIKRNNYPILRPSGLVRIDAANALYSIGVDNPKKIKHTAPDLLKILHKDHNAAVRITVLIPLIIAGGWDVVEDILEVGITDRWHEVRISTLTAIQFLINLNPSKRKIRSIVPIIKKIAREDKYEFVQEAAKDLLELFDEILKTE